MGASIRTGPQLSAADPRASVWVAASAGSGKTHVLSDRVLRLLLDGAAPGALLCLTFTKAAAAEMANRIHAKLAEWVRLDDDELIDALTKLSGIAPDEARCARARRLFAVVLDLPGGLKIQTVHSFCDSLLARFPLEAGLGPHFKVMDDRTAGELLAQARDAVLAIGDQPGPVADALKAALRDLAAQLGDDGFARIFGALIGVRARLRRLLDSQGGVEGALRALRHHLGLAEEDTADSIRAAASAEGAFDERDLRRAARALAQGGKSDVVRAATLVEWLDAPDRRKELYGEYLEVYLTKKGAVRDRLATASALAAEPALVDILDSEAVRLLAVEARRKAAEAAVATAALLHLGEMLIDAYGVAKKRRGALDYDDLILQASHLLASAGGGWVHYKLDGGIDHVLVDEAQDTSPEQWRVIAALADEFFAGEGAREGARTLFAVGDVKQSIFSFQGADPAAFTRMHAHFQTAAENADQVWLDVPLDLSFRSTPAVLSAVDAVFAEPGTRDGLSFDDRPIHHSPHRGGEAGLVEIWPALEPSGAAADHVWPIPVDQEGGDDPGVRLAARIAKQIRLWLDEGEMLPARARTVRAGDFLILVRRRGAFFEAMVRALKACGVAVAGSDRMVLTEELAVMDLLALGRFVLLPEDNLSLAELLKSPLIGFSEEDLFDLAAGRAEDVLWNELRRRRGERPDFAAACARLSGWLGRADFVPPYEFYDLVLGAERGRARLVARLGPEINDPLDEFLALALSYERGHAASLQGFLAWLESGQSQVKRDLEQGRDEVRVMTVHGAKGLQAPIVFLPDTCQPPTQNDDFFWLTGRGDADLLFWPPRRDLQGPIGETAAAAARLAREREYRRLLYVALTRAEDRLYIGGYRSRSASAQGAWYDLIEAALKPRCAEVLVDFGDGEGPQTVWRLTSAQTVTPRPADGAAVAPSPSPLPAWAMRPAPPEPAPPRPLAPSRPETPEPGVLSPMGGDDGAQFRRGRLIHRLLQTLPDLPPERRAAAAGRYLQGSVHGLSGAEQADMAAAALSVLEDSEFAPLFGPGSQAEVAVTGVLGGDQVISGQIDRLVILPERILIVDYKTNRKVPDGARNIAVAYKRQMAAYRALLAQIYPDRPVRCGLLWTQGPILMALDDRDLDAHAP